MKDPPSPRLRRDKGWRIDCGLSSRWTRCDAEGFFDCYRIVNFSALDYGGDVTGVANVLRRVAIDEDHVGQFSGGDDAEVFRYAHHLSRR